MPFLLIDKPTGITSFRVIAMLRKITGEQKIGHAGTLDPFASGLLIVGVGRESTKRLDEFLKQDKVYEAEVTLGATTPTLDPEGEVTTDENARDVSEKELRAALASQTGDLLQVPPMFSAIKKDGKKMYELARKGQTVDLPPRPITVYECALTETPSFPLHLPASIRLRIHASSGTYIRAIARDLGANLGTLGYLTALRRSAIGSFSVSNAAALDQLTAENWQTFCLPE